MKSLNVCNGNKQHSNKKQLFNKVPRVRTLDAQIKKKDRSHEKLI